MAQVSAAKDFFPSWVSPQEQDRWRKYLDHFGLCFLSVSSEQLPQCPAGTQGSWVRDLLWLSCLHSSLSLQWTPVPGVNWKRRRSNKIISVSSAKWAGNQQDKEALTKSNNNMQELLSGSDNAPQGLSPLQPEIPSLTRSFPRQTLNIHL